MNENPGHVSIEEVNQTSVTFNITPTEDTSGGEITAYRVTWHVRESMVRMTSTVPATGW